MTRDDLIEMLSKCPTNSEVEFNLDDVAIKEDEGGLVYSNPEISVITTVPHIIIALSSE